MPGSNVPAEYIRLAFWIDRHFPGYVDAYFGPPELKDQAADGDLPLLHTLKDFAFSLSRSILTDPDLSPDRRAYLKEELQAMRATLQILAGNPPGIVDEVRLLYGVTPAWVSESVFEEAHLELDEIIPGSEPLADRVRGFRERSRLPVDVALSIIRNLMDNFRRRTDRLFVLPSGEGCELVMVADQPWRAYNWYLGQFKSRIEFNQDFPMEMWNIPATVAHETYPGHHAEHAIKERKLYLEEGRLEHSIALSNTPSALISEGIANNALRAIASENEIEVMFIDCYKQASLPRSDAERARSFAQAFRELNRVGDNQILMLYRDHAADEEVVDYGVRYSLGTKEEEIRNLRFFKDPLSRSYVYNYTLGRELIAAYLDRAPDRQHAFQRLLSEPFTPEQIRQLAEQPG